jgi:hypothetical protein
MQDKTTEEILRAWVCTAYESKLKSGAIPTALLEGCARRAVDLWHESGDALLQYRHAEAAVTEQLEKAVQYVYGSAG